MFIKVIANETVALDNNIIFDSIENTMSISEVNNTHVSGKIKFSHTSVEYDLQVKSSIVFENEYEYNCKNMDLAFNIRETEDLNEENTYISEKTLDLNAKIWENIVVEIFNYSFDQKEEVDNENGMMEEEVIEVDERLAPLLKLLENNEEV